MSFFGIALRRGRLAALPLCVASTLAADPALRGTEQPNVSPEANAQDRPSQSAHSADSLAKDLGARQLELHGIEDTIGASEEQRRKIEAEIESMRNDRARLSAALLDTTQKVSEDEQKMNDAEARIATLAGSEDAIRRSLESRRSVIAEVLASLQRMGRRPPPRAAGRAGGHAAGDPHLHAARRGFAGNAGRDRGFGLGPVRSGEIARLDCNRARGAGEGGGVAQGRTCAPRGFDRCASGGAGHGRADAWRRARFAPRISPAGGQISKI